MRAPSSFMAGLGPGPRPRARVSAWLMAAILLFAALPAWAQGIGFDDVLPVDEALAVSAEAVAPDRIEIRWAIADGYYLYRHRMGARVEPGITTGPLQLPAGRRHTDAFFGEVETYRHQVTGVLAGAAAGDAGPLQVEVHYQGCADVGICYPPQTRVLRVALPHGATGASRAPAASDSGFAAFGRALGGNDGGRAPTLTAANDALPPARAFAFEAIAGDGNTILLRFTPAKGYYLYRDRNRFEVRGAEGIRAGAPRWPAGQAHHDAHFGDVTVYFDQIDVPLPLLRTTADAADVDVVATFQGCQDDGICYPPMTRTVRVAVPEGRIQTEATAAPAGTAPAGEPTATAAFASANDAAPAAPAAPAATGGIAPAAAWTNAPASSDASADNVVRSRPPGSASIGLAAALGLALLGGVLLNLMPCVLPILSLKVLGIATRGGSRAAARAHALWYTAGVLVAFAGVGLLAIALRAAGQAMGWGFQLQQPWFVAALAYLMFAVGLSLSGVFSLGGRVGNVGHALAGRAGPVGDFFTGVLACVVASPCIAPFMGGALAYAFTASPPMALAVFLMLGLGLALPFLLIGLVPALADRLPRPGAWMETLKQALAFPMYLTALWLAWVLGKQRGVDAMALLVAGMTVLALALWWFERRRWTGHALHRALALALALVALLPVIAIGRLAAPASANATASAGGTHVAYSAERLAALRAAGTPVLVNMTADWCVTCKANERRVLSGATFRAALADAGATYMVGDWTDVDPEIGAFLEAHGAVGVPLYVVYPAGGGDGVVLPALLSDAIIVAALGRAGSAG